MLNFKVKGRLIKEYLKFVNRLYNITWFWAAYA